MNIADYLDKVAVPEWRKAWKMLSVLWGTLCAAAAPLWVALSAEQQQQILGVVGVHPAMYVSAAFVIGIVLRLKAQGITVPKDAE